MNSVYQEIQVTFRFPVHFTEGIFDLSNTLLRDTAAAAGGSPARAVVVIDRGVLRGHRTLLAAMKQYFAAFADVLTLTRPPLVLPGGEKVKNVPRYYREILRAIHDGGLCRHSYVIAIGGGALLDVAGYAAATAHRGIRLIRVPTTVLSQDDSGVGVKNGVNAFGKKNYLGVFAPPFAVINDFRFLTTLSDRDWRSGISEAVKGSLIKDASFFEFLELHAARLAQRDQASMQLVVRRCAELHCAHIAGAGDPFELGSSRPLDFGHWAAHRLEHLTNYRLRHGEAVAIGIALDSTYSYLAGSLAESDWRRILTLLRDLGLPVHAHALERHSELVRGLTEFREHLGGNLTVMLLAGIGKAYDVNEIDPDLVARSAGVLKEWARADSENDRQEAYAKPEGVAR